MEDQTAKPANTADVSKDIESGNANNTTPNVDNEGKQLVAQKTVLKGLTLPEEEPKLKAARDFTINYPAKNEGKYCSNYIRTTRYTLLTFFPVSMFY